MSWPGHHQFGRHSPQPPYPPQNYPPPNQVPPPSQYPPPPQNMSYPQQQYQQPYGNPAAQYGAPPPVPYPPPPQSHSPYPQQGYPPPPQQQGYPPQGYLATPLQSFGAPPLPAQGYGPPPPQPGYGVPPNAYAPPPTPPSLGYDPNQVANVDTMRDAEALRNSMKGFGTRENQLLDTLVRIPDPVIMANLRHTYNQRLMRDLMKDVDSETSGYFRETLLALVRGPLHQDVHNIHEAIRGAGTNETVLNDVLLGRSNVDMHAIKREFHRLYHKDLEWEVRDDLSGKTERLFAMVLAGQRQEDSAPVIPQELDRDVTELHRATDGRMGTDQITVCQILSSHSDGQLRALAQEFHRKYHKPLSKVIASEFSGHMKDALLRMLAVAEDRAMADAHALEDNMRGAGTKDRLLLNRIVRIHWDRNHLSQVKGAYRHAFKRELSARVRGETSGHYQKTLVALVEQ